ncbi:MAG: calcium/sodium antiporter [Burkholderiales bacterium]
MVTLMMFVGGLALLVVGAEALVRGAGKLAISVGVSPLVVGLTVVAFGTSSPEMAVSVQSAMAGKVDIAVGNVVGSNIFNVWFILGVCALVAPLVINRQIIRQEVPIMIGATLLLAAFMFDGSVNRVEAVIMFGLLVAYTVFLVVQSRRESTAAQAEGADDIDMSSTWDRHWGVQLVLVVIGLVLLVQGSNWFVEAAIIVAKAMGVSELVIGLTIVAAGTSMPEVATSIMATIRGHRDIAVGNVIGSNTFNILGVLGLTGIVAPTGLAVAPSVLTFDMWVMLAVAVACLPVFFTGREIARWEGGVFVGYYAAYTAYLILMSQEHDALPMLSNVMFSFVVPITIVTIIASLIRPKTLSSS